MITKDQTGHDWIAASNNDKQEYVQRKCAGAKQESLGSADPLSVAGAIDEFFAFPGNRANTVSIAFGLMFTAISGGHDYKKLLPPT
jgi:hypothetical protein